MSRLISVPQDNNNLVLAEICFGSSPGRDGEDPEDVALRNLFMVLMCMPQSPVRGAAKTRRFSVGDRVVCAVEDRTQVWTEWKAGTVAAVDHSVKADAEKLLPRRTWEGQKGIIP